LKTLFLYFLVYEKSCECQSFLCNENTKKWWHLRSLEYGKGWHESKEIFQWCPEIEFATTNYCPIAFKAQQAIFLVEKELHYDNVIRLCVLLYFWCELPLRNASEGSLIILKMTAVKNCWKTTRIYNRIIRSIREQRFWEQRSFQICHYLCFLNSIFIFSEPGKWINEINEILKQFTSNGGKTPWICCCLFVIA